MMAAQEREKGGALAITRWRGLYEPKGEQVHLTWSELAAMFARPASRPPNPEVPELPGWSCATFANDRRAKGGARLVTALCLDHDKGAPSLEALRAAYAGRRALVHNTRRSRPSASRWRVVVAVSRPMTVEEHALVWAHERDRLAALGLFVDEQTKDASRFWFVPCEPAEGEFVFSELEGEPIDVDAVVDAARATLPLATRSASTLETTPPTSAVVTSTVTEPAELQRIALSTRKRRAAAWLQRAEASVSGDRGHDTAFRVAGSVVRSFALDEASALEVLSEWNSRAVPPWSPRELQHKVTEAMRTADVPWGAKLLASAEPRSEATEPREPRTIALLSAVDLAKPLPDLDYLVPSLGLATGAPALVAGYGFSGKTISLQSLALSIATGRPVWGVFGCRRGRVLHLDFEQGSRVTADRYQRIARGMGIELAGLGDALNVGVNPAVYLDDVDALDVYKRTFEGAALVIVDSLRAGAQKADENASDIRRSIDLMNRAAETHDALVVFVHHARKPKADDPDGARYKIRGSSALFDACGSVFVFSAEKDQPTKVEHEKCRNRGTLVDDFGLRIEDVEIDGNPKAGLRVVHLEAEQLEASQSTGRTPHADAMRRIVEFLRAEGGTFRGAKSSVRAHVRMGRERFFAAFNELEARGEIDASKDEAGRAFVRLGQSWQSEDRPGPNGTDTDSPVRSDTLGSGTGQDRIQGQEIAP